MKQVQVLAFGFAILWAGSASFFVNRFVELLTHNDRVAASGAGACMFALLSIGAAMFASCWQGR